MDRYGLTKQSYHKWTFLNERTCVFEIIVTCTLSRFVIDKKTVTIELYTFGRAVSKWNQVLWLKLLHLKCKHLMLACATVSLSNVVRYTTTADYFLHSLIPPKVCSEMAVVTLATDVLHTLFLDSFSHNFIPQHTKDEKSNILWYYYYYHIVMHKNRQTRFHLQDSWNIQLVSNDRGPYTICQRVKCMNQG